MDFGIRGKVALVGGGSKGLGRASAEALAGEGARVAICARKAAEVERVAAEIAAATGSEVVGVAADLQHPDGPKLALDFVKERLGPPDILVANTGGPRPGKFDHLSDADWDAAHELLLKSAIRLIRGVLPAMRERGWGRIVGITSVSVKEPIDMLLLSNAYRAAVTALFKTLATDLAAEGITVNTVLPGLTDTDRMRQLYQMQAMAKKITVEEQIVEATKTLPRRKLNEARELGRLVAFLASDLGSGISGCAIPVDGSQLKAVM